MQFRAQTFYAFSVHFLYVGFSVSLVFRFLGFKVVWMRWDARFFRPDGTLFRFLGFKVFWMRWDARFFRLDGTLFRFLGFKVFWMGLDAELEKYKVSPKRSNLNGQWSPYVYFREGFLSSIIY